MKKFAIHVGGGLGDLIKVYFRGWSGFGHLDAIRQKHPLCKLRLIITSSNPASRELFELDPSFDDILIGPWENPNFYPPREIWHEIPIKRRRHWKDPNGLLDDYELLWDQSFLTEKNWRLPRSLFLSAKEEATLESVVRRGPYVFLHPFAGGTERMVVKRFACLCDKIIDELGYNVVVIGRDWVKDGERRLVFKERFDYERPGLIKFINTAGPRLGVALVQRSVAFVGANSAYFVASASRDIPAVVFTRRKTADLMKAPIKRWWVKPENVHLIEHSPAASPETALNKAADLLSRSIKR